MVVIVDSRVYLLPVTLFVTVPHCGYGITLRYVVDYGYSPLLLLRFGRWQLPLPLLVVVTLLYPIALLDVTVTFPITRCCC